MNFWLLTTLISAIIATLALYPFLRHIRNDNQDKRDKLNKAFYFDRLQEVERENREGVIDDLEQSKLELQQSLLDDIPAQQSQNQHRHANKGWFALLLVAVCVTSAGIYQMVGTKYPTAMLELSHQKLDYFYERIKNEENEPLSTEELNQFAMALKVELQQNPQDDKGWFMLGQVGMALENGQLAFDGFNKAAQLQPNNIKYKSSYAQMLMFSNDPRDKERGEEVLKEILRMDHTNLDALSLLAFNAFEKEDYKMAAMTWGMMVKLLPEDEPRREVLERSIISALALLKEQEEQNPPKSSEQGNSNAK